MHYLSVSEPLPFFRKNKKWLFSRGRDLPMFSYERCVTVHLNKIMKTNGFL